MKEKNYFLIGSIIIAISLVTCAFILKDSNLLNSYIPIPSERLTVSFDNLYKKTNKAEDKQALSRAEAARYLGISQGQIMSLMARDDENKIPFIKLGREEFFSKKALNDWLERAANEHYVDN